MIYLVYIMAIALILHVLSMLYGAYKAATYNNKPFDFDIYFLMFMSQSLLIKPKRIKIENLQKEYEIALSYNKIPILIFFLCIVVATTKDIW